MRYVLALMLLFAWLPAAAITCTSITSPGVTINYVNGSTASMQGTFTVSCTRVAGDAAASVTYSVVNDRGVNPLAFNGSASLQYYLGSLSCAASNKWKGASGIGSTISDTMSLPSTGTFTKQTSFFLCVSAQTATTAGLYSDTAMLTLSYTGGVSITGTSQVRIYAPATCNFTTPPGNISVSYTALGPQVSGSTNFNVQCTIGMPYTLATDVPEGVLNNLRYILSLSSLGTNGTGAPQLHTVTATIPAGQAGTCAVASCTAQQTHTLTISY
jgi:spore coat protein U-like protein